MTNEQDSYEAVKTVVSATMPLQTGGPFVAVTPHISDPDPYAEAAVYATIRKELESRS